MWEKSVGILNAAYRMAGIWRIWINLTYITDFYYDDDCYLFLFLLLSLWIIFGSNARDAEQVQ